MKQLMIYGATGYTGRMAAGYARAAGTPIVIAGRSEAPLARLASELGVEFRVFSLDETATIDGELEGISVILNCAGPFMRTADILMRASIRNGVHYLDTAAELDSYRLAEALDEEAKAAGVMLLPGGGGSVAMLGSLAGHAVGRVTDPRKIRIALHVAGGLSRGSAISATENLTAETLQRVDGRLVSRAADDIGRFDFGKGVVDCFPVTLPDLITIWRATHVPDIETFVHVTGDGFPQGDLSALPDGPSEEERLANRYQAVIEVTDAEGLVTRFLLDTVNGYTFTATAAAEAGRRVLQGEAKSGFQTPAGLFGNGFAGAIADTTIVDVTGASHATLVDDFVRTTNAFDVRAALSLFAPDAVIDDASVGDAFVGGAGIRRYLERFFVGYKTQSRPLSIESLDDRNAIVRLDFTGDFGHETGILKIAVNSDGLIGRIDADLE